MAEKPPKPENREASPRFRDRAKAEKVRDSLQADNSAAVVAELKSQTDRGAAIIAGSVLDELLKSVIEKRLSRLDTDQRKALFGRMMPLSTFSAKIEIGLAIGVYDNATYKQLKMIQAVRNKFAHRIESLRFNHPDITKIIDDPARKRVVRVKSGGAVKPRDEFMVTFAVLTALLYAIRSAEIRIPSLTQSHPQIFLETAAIVQQVVEGMLQKRQSNPPQDTPEPKTQS